MVSICAQIDKRANEVRRKTPVDIRRRASGKAAKRPFFAGVVDPASLTLARHSTRR
jgi:hypothetical protein